MFGTGQTSESVRERSRAERVQTSEFDGRRGSAEFRGVDWKFGILSVNGQGSKCKTDLQQTEFKTIRTFHGRNPTFKYHTSLNNSPFGGFSTTKNS